MPVVKVGRIAGQYAKPRSSDTRRGRPALLPRRHGQRARADRGGAPARPGPARARVRQRGGGDEPHARDHRRRPRRPAPPARVEHGLRPRRRAPASATSGSRREIDRSLRFMSACGVDDSSLRTVEMFASHEMLVLDYERALLRLDERPAVPALRPPAVDRRPHAPARRRARRARGADRQPDRREDRPERSTPEEAVELVERLDPRARRRARDARLADGQRARSATSCRRSSRR